MQLLKGKGKTRQAGWVAIGLGFVALGSSLPAQADIVADWADTGARTVTGAAVGVPPLSTPEDRSPNYSVDLATLHIAIYDTVVAFEGGYDPFAAVPASLPAGASFDAAVHEAAYQVLSTLFPARSAHYLTDYTNRMAAAVVADGAAAVNSGRAVGADVAAQVIALRSNDGRENLVDISWASNPNPPAGQFVPSGPALAGRGNPNTRPFVMTNAAQFRPAGPPALTSEQYAEDYNEIQQDGIDDARSTRTQAEDDLAQFGTSPPPLFWTRNLNRFANLPETVDNARLMAAIWVAHSDASIACFEAKYYYKFWRPRTAIPNGGVDGNDATDVDGSWLPNNTTPNHPEYPAAHSCASASSFEVIRQLNGNKKKLSFFMDFAPNVLVRPYDSTDDFLKDIKDARVLGGMHFRTSTDDGTNLGRQVAKYVLKHHFRPVD